MAASYGTLVLAIGDRTVSVDVYTPDAVATLHTYNPLGLAASTSPSQFVMPADGYVVDYVQVAAPNFNN